MFNNKRDLSIQKFVSRSIRYLVLIIFTSLSSLFALFDVELSRKLIKGLLFVLPCYLINIHDRNYHIKIITIKIRETRPMGLKFVMAQTLLTCFQILQDFNPDLFNIIIWLFIQVTSQLEQIGPWL